MTANKPKVLAYHVNKENPAHRGVTLEPLILLSDYEALQDERDALVEALSALRGCIMETRGPDAHSALVLADAALAKATGEEQ